MHVICIGSSAASLACAGQLRRLSKDVQITVLTQQAEKPYNTCFLADYLAGRRTRESLYLPIPDVSLEYHAEVISVDNNIKKVITTTGKEYCYDKLFIGTGVTARIPEIFLPELYKRIFPFKSLHDIVLFEQHEKSMVHRSVAVVGGGVTGVEACEALVLRGYTVTLFEKNAHLLASFNNQDISQRVYDLLSHHGVTVMLNAHENAALAGEYSTIFLALGSCPGDTFFTNQIITDNGYIVVDERQQTSCKDIFAGGDCVKGRSLWPQAFKDGVVAAYSIINIHKSKIITKNLSPKIILIIFGDKF